MKWRHWQSPCSLKDGPRKELDGPTFAKCEMNDSQDSLSPSKNSSRSLVTPMTRSYITEYRWYNQGNQTLHRKVLVLFTTNDPSSCSLCTNPHSQISGSARGKLKHDLLELQSRITSEVCKLSTQILRHSYKLFPSLILFYYWPKRFFEEIRDNCNSFPKASFLVLQDSKIWSIGTDPHRHRSWWLN